jgi:hypothetical protein
MELPVRVKMRMNACDREFAGETESALTLTKAITVSATGASFQLKIEKYALVMLSYSPTLTRLVVYVFFLTLMIPLLCESDARQGNCFTSVLRGICRGKLSARLTKRDCCCGFNMGKGKSLSEFAQELINR